VRFERLIQSYLKTDNHYSNLFETVWLWSEFPYRRGFGGGDTGIDIVALTKNGEYWAVQCKCYAKDTEITKKTVDSFLATSSRSFATNADLITQFSQRLWVSTSDCWGHNAREVFENQVPPVTILHQANLEASSVDWDKLENGIHGAKARKPKKELKEHQKYAVKKTHEYFLTESRGKLIMACGTGKTYTSLKIAETETQNRGFILVLVPSIALVGQTFREWVGESEKPIYSVCICSDPKVSVKRTRNHDLDMTRVVDLGVPASTNADVIFRRLKEANTAGMTVVFSTYQSIGIVAEVQKKLKKEFDLIICDEAHRTTGITLAGDDESAFVKVHDNSFIASKKRMYMTATPRLYSDSSKKKAEEHDAILCSMDNEEFYGKEIYRLGFSSAVTKGLLTDYKVLILTLSERDLSPSIRRMIFTKEKTVNIADIPKLVGCINALSKQMSGNASKISEIDPVPMKRAGRILPDNCNKQANIQLFQRNIYKIHRRSVQRNAG
jgi:predicted helicase